MNHLIIMINITPIINIRTANFKTTFIREIFNTVTPPI